MKREEPKLVICAHRAPSCSLEPGCARKPPVLTIMEMVAKEGDSPVWACGETSTPGQESGCLGLQSKAGGKLHLRLNTDERPIANKYREGKMKRTLKKELKVREIAGMEAIGMAEPSVHPAKLASPYWWPVTLQGFALGQLQRFGASPSFGRRAGAPRLRRPKRPVLKHGPRSSASLRVPQSPHCGAQRKQKQRHLGGAVHAASSEREARWPGASRLSTLAETR